MYNLSRTGRERATNIWPGFVDGLATLLLVLVFVLLVFMVGQFFLSTALTNRDTRLAELTTRLDELSDLLSLERQANENLRVDVSQLSSELQASLGQRESLAAQLSALTEQRDRLAGDLARLVNERDVLANRLELTETQLRQSTAELAEAQQQVAADRATIEAQLAEVQALQTLRDRLRLELTGLEGRLAIRDETVGRLERQLGEAEATSQTRAERIETLEREALSREDELAAQIAALEALRARVEARDAELAELEAELAAQARALTEAQSSLSDREERIVELRQFLEERADELAQLQTSREQARAALAETEAELSRTQDFATDQQRLSETAQREVERLNRQLLQLREQLAALNEALEASEALNREQQVEIVNLGQRLNAALATKVQELARYRSEFFGRLREVLGDNPDVRIVGDRFVFQSEVLFASASARLQSEGAEQIASLADTLIELAEEIPADLDWVLRVDGHTDSLPIATAQFPSNWELSTARAIEVVQFLIARGLPENRLVAAGFADNWPIAQGGSPDALSRNRRIEFKLTQR
ncbi:peptidoglycan -binding protein [Algihabitans albus]|uniref:peptidoglycan -binding protein n=1 Tax=Algihabitans albus TaxID=2164067 RepID=UPI000E5DA3C6|nr:peptidoglycan -binding protein [Algihabitans albus]